MGEMSAILARRRKASNNPAPKKEEPQNDSIESSPKKFSTAEEAHERPAEKAATMPRPKSLSNKESSPSPASPSTASASRMKMIKKNSEGSGSDGLDVDRLKQEILDEVKKELHKVKEEIIAALTQQLQVSQPNGEDASSI